MNEFSFYLKNNDPITQITILHMLQQLNCYDMGKFVT